MNKSLFLSCAEQSVVQIVPSLTRLLPKTDLFDVFPYATISFWNMLNIQNIELSFGMQPSINCLLGNLAADLMQEHIYNSNGD